MLFSENSDKENSKPITQKEEIDENSEDFRNFLSELMDEAMKTKRIAGKKALFDLFKDEEETPPTPQP